MWDQLTIKEANADYTHKIDTWLKIIGIQGFKHNYSKRNDRNRES